MKFEVKPYGLNGAFLSFGDVINISTHKEVKSLYLRFKEYSKQGIVAVIPGYCSLTVMFEPSLINFKQVEQLSKELYLNKQESSLLTYLVEVPVCYDKSLALDYQEIEEYSGLRWEEVIELHTQNTYLVYMLGFIPGFLYLGGLSEKLFIPRKEEPRLKVPKGSVGLAGDQTGIYPVDIPGGWQILGRSPANLLETNKVNRVEMGDVIKFKPISLNEYNNYNLPLERVLLNED